VNLIAGLIAYRHQPTKPLLNLSREDSALLPTRVHEQPVR
jgi:hypothetical protein